MNSQHNLIELIKDTQSFLLGSVWSRTGEDFFRALAEYLARKLSVDYVCIDRLLPDNEAQTVAIYYDGHFEDNVKYRLEDTPCGKVTGIEVCCFTSRVRHLFPNDVVLQEMNAESYAGITLWGTDQKPIGLIAVIGRKPLEDTLIIELVLKQVSIRAAAELEHRNFEENLLYFTYLVESVSDAIISTDANFAITSWNNAATMMYGWQHDEVIGKRTFSTLETVYPENTTMEDAARQLEEQGSWTGEVVQKRKNGDQIIVHSSVTLIKNKSGEVIGVVAINKDITDRKRAEDEIMKSHSRLEMLVRERTEDLRRSEEKYRTVADFTNDWETWTGPDGKYIYVSPACQKITGYSIDEFMNEEKLILKISHPSDREKLKKHLKESLTGSISECSFDFRIIARNGEEHWIGHNCQSVFDSRGNWIGQRGSNRDITDRKKDEQVLKDSQKYLRALTQKMDAIGEDERKSVAREIHDELGHLLTVIKYDIENLMSKSELSEELFNDIDELRLMIISLIDSVRRIATELRPGILDHLGLLPAIEWQIRQFQQKTKICCKIQLPETDFRFNDQETTIIFRILQEILTNVAKHSKASHVWISINNDNGVFSLTVKDNGIGFELDKSYYSGSLGLLGMNERAISIGGEILVDSQPGSGTKVNFTMKRN